MALLKSKLDTRTVEQKQEEFLEKLEVYGNFTEAAKLAKVPRRTLYNWLSNKDEHKDFIAKYDVSMKIGIQAVEDEAKRRAFKGSLEPVFYKGKKIANIRKYSDTLMIVLLKAHYPEKYKDRIEHGGDPEKPIKHEATVTTTIVQFRDMTQPPDQQLASQE